LKKTKFYVYFKKLKGFYIYCVEISQNNQSYNKKMLSCLANVKRENSDRPSIPPQVVYATYVGDRSGSMRQQSNASANGVYEWVKGMCSGVINNGQKGYISVTFFDTQVEKRLENIEMDKVEISMQQAREWSSPRGSTQLYDTAIEAINILRRQIKSHKKDHPEKTVHGVFQLFSDGFDNSSRSTEAHLNAAIKSAKEEGISCIYLGIGQDAIEMGQRYGFEARSSLSADVGEDTAEFAFRGVTLNALRSATSGQTQGMSESLRMSSAPSNYNPVHNLRQPAAPSLRQSTVVPPSMSTLRASARPYIPRC